MNKPPESEAANKYCDETVTHMIDIENMEDEAIIPVSDSPVLN